MRVLTVSFSISGHGAYSRHKEMAKAFLHSGHDVVWIGPKQSDVQHLKGIIFLPLFWEVLLRYRVPGKLLCFLYTFLKYRLEFIKANKIFVINEVILLSFKIFSLFYKVNDIVFFPRQDEIAKQKYFLSISQNLKEKYISRARSWFYSRIIKYCSTAVIVQTSAIKKNIITSCSLSAARISVLPNSINASWMMVERKNIRSLVELPDNCKIIGVVCSFYWRGKGLDLLFDVIYQMRNEKEFQWVLIGDGPDWAKLHSMLKGIADLQTFHMLGRLDNAAQYFSSFDTLVVTSAIDYCPNVILESMLMNCPVICTNIEAHQFLLGDDFPGLIDPNCDLFVKKIIEINSDITSRYCLLEKQNDARTNYDFDWNEKLINLMIDGLRKDEADWFMGNR